MDESIYVLYGRMFLTAHFEPPIDHPLHFSFGWYLWPALAAAADRLGGIVGVRELAALLGLLTVLAVYGFARRLFSPAVGLASAAVFAFLGPAVLTSRIATRDVAAICFLALGLWLSVRAWQQREWQAWLASAGFFFAAFLCKYLVALYFPFLALLSFRRSRRAALWFTLPLALSCGGYVLAYASDLAALLRYGHTYASLQAPLSEAWRIYVTQRLDFWILLGLSLLAWERGNAASQWTAGLLWLGAAIMPVFQWVSRADYDYWKHVNYSLFFLTPLAAQGLLRGLRRQVRVLNPLAGAGVVAVLALSLDWAGDAWRIDRFLFWPNAEPIAAFFEGRLVAEDWVLVDDSVLRYYLQPPLRQRKIADPFYFRYRDLAGEAAYTAAVHDGAFDFIALDGGVSPEARRMRAAIQPEIAGHYVLKLSMADPVLGQAIQIYERITPPPAKPEQSGPRVEILDPANQAVVMTDQKTTVLHGQVTDAGPGWYVRVDVFTNRWYPQGGKIFPRAEDGSFSQQIYLAGGDRQQCNHLVRARLYDEHGRPEGVALNFGIARANPDGSAPPCR